MSPHNLRWAVMIIAIIGMRTTSSARGDDAASVVSALFGDKIKKVDATPARADDVTLAIEIVDAINGDAITDAMRAPLCAKACELGMRDASGFPSVIAAILKWPREDSLAKQMKASAAHAEYLNRIFLQGKAAERTAAGPMLIEALLIVGDGQMETGGFSDAISSYRKASTIVARAKPAAAGTVKAKLELAMYRERTTRSIEQLRTKLLENRTDSVAAEALVRLLIVDQGDVKTATTYLDAVKDEGLKQILQLCGKPLAELGADDAMRLADWFHDAAKTAQGPALAASLNRAKAAYEQTLARSEAGDIARAKAALRLKDVTQQLSKIDSGPTAQEAAAFDDAAAALKQLVPVDAKKLALVTAPKLQQRLDAVKKPLLRGEDRGKEKTERGSWAAQVWQGKSGLNNFIVYGPYTELAAGKYILVARVMLNEPAKADVNTTALSFSYEGRTLAERAIAPSELSVGEWHVFALFFDLRTDLPSVEYRIWQNGWSVSVDRIYLFKCE